MVIYQMASTLGQRHDGEKKTLKMAQDGPNFPVK